MKKISSTLAVLTLSMLLTSCGSPDGITDAAGTANADTAAVVYEQVEIRHYEDGGAPYLHAALTNQTAKNIVSMERSMLAYDREGKPLKLVWDFLDSSCEPSYEYICEYDFHLSSGGTDDSEGGWSLEEESPVAYALYCPKSITFADGSFWENPYYKAWRDTWCGKEADPELLESYYPARHDINVFISRHPAL